MTWLCHADLFAQLPVFSGDARSEGMAGAQVMLSDHWSGLLNPACLAGVKSPVFGLFCRNFYQVPELSQLSSSLGLPTQSGCFGLGYAVVGHSGLSQHHAIISYGHTLGAKVCAGIGIHYLNLRQPEGYGNFNVVLPSAGIKVMPAAQFTLAFTWFNPANQQYSATGYSDIPSVICVGAGVQFDRDVLLCFEIRKNIHQKINYFGGFEVNIIKPLFIRLGISSADNQRFSTGLGMKLKRISFDLSAVQHPVLDYVTAISVNFNLKSQKPD